MAPSAERRSTGLCAAPRREATVDRGIDLGNPNFVIRCGASPSRPRDRISVTRLAKADLLRRADRVDAAILLAACGSSGSPGQGGSRRLDHALQRPARTDDGAARRGVRKGNRDQGPRPLRRRGDARQPDPAGAGQLAGRRLLHGEHAGARSAARARPARAGRRGDARGGAEAATSRRRATGWACRRACRCSSTTQSQVGVAKLPTSILELASPQWQGKVGFAPSETDFQPLVSSIEKLDGRAAAERWLKALKANGKIYPDNETVVAQVNNGAERDRADQPLLLVPAARRGRRRRARIRRSSTSRPATPATSSTCRAPRC